MQRYTVQAKNEHGWILDQWDCESMPKAIEAADLLGRYHEREGTLGLIVIRPKGDGE